MLMHCQYLHSSSHLYYNHTSAPWCQWWPFLNIVCDSRTKVLSPPDLQVELQKSSWNSIMYEDERYVGKARSALWCISLIYYLTDFQALILSTLQEESPFLPPLSWSTCDIMGELSASSSMGYNFRALGRVWNVRITQILINFVYVWLFFGWIVNENVTLF